jgi:hypothetical protein
VRKGEFKKKETGRGRGTMREKRRKSVREGEL